MTDNQQSEIQQGTSITETSTQRAQQTLYNQQEPQFPQIDIQLLGLAPNIIKQIYSVGVTVLPGLNISDTLAAALQLDDDQLKDIKQTQEYFQDIQCITGTTGYEIDTSCGSIMTWCQALDALLQGGVHLREITELYGEPGTGKTQLCMQLAVSVQLPRELSGLHAEVLYIDTEGSVLVDRLIGMAEAAQFHVQQLSQTQPSLSNNLQVKQFTTESILSGIHVQRALSAPELISSITSAKSLLKANKNIKLVIIDSISFFLRQEIGTLNQRQRLIAQVALQLSQLAAQYGVAVVVTNHVTVRPSAKPDLSGAIVPSLGSSWSHVASTRISLSASGQPGIAQAYLVNSSWLPRGTVQYEITDHGIRDVPDPFISQ